MTAATQLSAVALVCTLNRSPSESSSELIAEQVIEELSKHGVAGSTVRVVDHDVPPGVAADLGAGDGWRQIREQVLNADIVLISTPTWIGQQSSVCQRVLERLNGELSETDDEGRPFTYGKVGLAAVVGNEDGAHHICATLFQCLSDVGFTLPAQAATYWNGEAMHKTDFKDLDQTPEAVSSATVAMASNSAHLARLLRASAYPPT